jgi:hypothetical protein
MFRKPPRVTTACDAACQAQKLREQTLFNAAKLGPRL